MYTSTGHVVFWSLRIFLGPRGPLSQSIGKTKTKCKYVRLVTNDVLNDALMCIFVGTVGISVCFLCDSAEARALSSFARFCVDTVVSTHLRGRFIEKILNSDVGANYVSQRTIVSVVEESINMFTEHPRTWEALDHALTPPEKRRDQKQTAVSCNLTF